MQQEARQRIKKDDVRGPVTPICHDDIEDFELIGDDPIRIAVPIDSSPELKRKVLAAAATHFLGQHSMDYVLKKYGSYWDFRLRLSKEQRLVLDMFKSARVQIEQSIQKINEIHNKPDRAGLFAAEAALIRLQTSFRAASLLIKRGFNFEAVNIARLILEQIAWAYSVHELRDERVFKVLPTKSVSNLSRLLPKVGRLYGLLSERAHISPHLAPSFVEFTEQGARITLADGKDSLSIAYILLLLTDAFSVVSEYIVRDFTSVFGTLIRDSNGGFRVKDSRPFLITVNKYKRKLASGEV